MNFTPPPGLKNRHINTILGSNGPRKWIVDWRGRELRRAASEVVLSCADGVRLHGLYSPHPNPHRGLAILIHGWEGSAHSTYLLSTASHLYAQGFSIFRLHLRDHGPTHHLNRAPFLAIALDEVLDALAAIQAQFPHDATYLAGYSLGGNMALRAAARLRTRAVRLDKVVAVCPPIDPKAASEALRNHPVYNRYFVGKWKASFEKKMIHFPEHRAHADIFTHRDLLSLHEAFVPRYSDHPDATSYFKAYTLNGDSLPRLDAPSHIVMAADDPVVPIDTARLLPDLKNLSLEVTSHGGHCGFIADYALHAWIDERIERLFR